MDNQGMHHTFVNAPIPIYSSHCDTTLISPKSCMYERCVCLIYLLHNYIAITLSHVSVCIVDIK